MDDLQMTIETEIALITKHIEEDRSRKDDPILGQFNRGRLVVEEQQLAVLKKLWDIATRS